MLLCVVLQLAAPLSARAVTLNAQEKAIADLLVNSSGQKRPFLQLDPVLTQVARSRAADMARRGYFAHVNPDGNGPNYLIKAAGYPLPDSWGNDRSTNYVESIAAGRDSASGTWNDWMHSPDHKRHLLAEDDFYQKETSYGVGFVSDPGSDYINYWVVITAPPRPAPGLSISSPVEGTKVSGSQVTLTGSTGGDVSAQIVEFRVENSSGIGAFKPATGVSKWTAVVTDLVPGSNVIRVRSKNASGEILAQATRTVRYVVLTPLMVSVEGTGSVTDGFIGQTQRELGVRYTISAKPGADSLFAGWSGGVSSSNNTLSFTMTEGLQLTATFVPNPFIARRGSYRGIVTAEADPSVATSGLINVAISPIGSFTGRLTLAGANYTLSGRFDINGTATVSIPRRNLPALTISLQLDVAGSGGISASVSDGSFTATAQTSRVRRTAAVSEHAGRYTVSLPADSQASGNTAVPQGTGYATLNVRRSGRIQMIATLADGRSFARAGEVSEQGTFAIYAPLYEGAGFIVGQLRFNETAVSDIEGALIWSKPARSADQYYPAGFATTLPVLGSRYVAPKTGTPVVPGGPTANNVALSLGEGNLAEPLVEPVTIGTGSRTRVSTSVTKGLTVTISPATGVFRGTFMHPVSGDARPIRGVIFQKQNAGYGYFLGIDRSGYSNLAPAQ